MKVVGLALDESEPILLLVEFISKERLQPLKVGENGFTFTHIFNLKSKVRVLVNC